MAADEAMNALPQSVGKKQHPQSSHSHEQDEGRELETPRSTKTFHGIGEDPDNEKIAAGDEDRHGRSQDGPRGVHIDLGPFGAHVGHRQQDTPDQEPA